MWFETFLLVDFTARPSLDTETMFFRLFHVFCCQNFIETVFSATKAHRSCVFYSGFKRTFLTSEVGDMWLENGLRESTRPCCFAAAELSLLAGSLSLGWFFVLWGYQSASEWLPRFQTKTTILRLSGFPNLIELCFYSGFRCGSKKGPVRPTRPCCFAPGELLFLVASLCCGGIWLICGRNWQRSIFFFMLSWLLCIFATNLRGVEKSPSVSKKKIGGSAALGGSP